jgi:hypothetical protein
MRQIDVGYLKRVVLQCSQFACSAASEFVPQCPPCHEKPDSVHLR